MFKRLRKIIKLSKKDSDSIDRLTDEQIDSLPEEGVFFFGVGTEKEFEELQKEDKGLKGIFGL